MDYIEFIGYAASILVAISLTMSQLLKLRIINLCGSATFSVYGFLIGAYPIFLVNSFIVIINIYYVVKMFRHRDNFEIIDGSDTPLYLDKFYNHYKKDIERFFKEFETEKFKNNKSIFILRNLRPVNLVVYNEQENGIVEIILDYTIPEYRDFLNGKYLISIFQQKEAGKRQIVTKSDSVAHGKYLRKIGFQKNDAGLFVTKI